MKLRDLKSAKARRELVEKITGVSLQHTGHFSLDEAYASSRNCENMVGVTQIPMGIAGPLVFKSVTYDKKEVFVPLATTEGALVASVNRGMKALFESGGATTNSHRVGTTRGPVFKVESLAQNHTLFEFLKNRLDELKKIAASTSSHLILKKLKSTGVGKYRYIRFYFDTQDAMGMNMATIATQKMATYIEKETGARCLSVSGNFCADKKVAWQNFINNRGIKTWAEVTIPENVLRTVLKTTAASVHEVWEAKCMLGGVMSGSLGFNAHAANMIAAIFIATGQDPGHIGEGSMVVTTTEIVRRAGSEDLYVSVYLPDLMVGTVGGGTTLATQTEALELLGVVGGDHGNNARKLAEIIAGAVLAGEISLLSSLEQGSLAQAHQTLARGK